MARRRKSTGALVLALCVGAVLWWLDHREDLALEHGEFRELRGCRLVAHRNNDGDSFHVATPDGNRQEFRLYFVDAPESALKQYRDGNSNEERLRFQAEYFGRLAQDQTTEVGQQAKKWTAKLLGQEPFTVYTRGEKVYNGPRLYGFVSVQERGQERWLHELLVERGLARIYTKGAGLPDGTKPGTQEKRLRSLERTAKSENRGAWGM